MKIKNQILFDKYIERYNNPQDASIADFAVRWAEMIEKRMFKNIKFEDIAESSSFQANIDNINRFLFAAAVEMLINTWEFGDRIGLWYNSSCGVWKIKSSPANKTDFYAQIHEQTGFIGLLGSIHKHSEMLIERYM